MIEPFKFHRHIPGFLMQAAMSVAETQPVPFSEGP
jgi:hypothetical protein